MNSSRSLRLEGFLRDFSAFCVHQPQAKKGLNVAEEIQVLWTWVGLYYYGWSAYDKY